MNPPIVPGLITFDEKSQEAVQSKGNALLKIIRLQSCEGRVVVPWKVVPDSPDSVYVGLAGKKKRALQCVGPELKFHCR